MAEAAMVERPLEKALLDKIYKGDKNALEEDIKNVQEEKGALNRASALRKLLREKGQRETNTNTTVVGYFLQQYRRRVGEDGESQYSVYIATPKGISTIHISDPRSDLPAVEGSGLTMRTFGEPQKWIGLVERENVLYGTKSLYARKGTTRFEPAKPDELSVKLGELSKPITQIEDGQGLWHAYISVVFPLYEFVDGKPAGTLPLVGTGGEANMRVGLTDEIDKRTGNPGNAKLFVNITSEGQLRALLGDYWDDSLLISDTVFSELRDALKSTPVLVFGSGLTPNNPRMSNYQYKSRMKGPKIQLSYGRGLIVPYNWDE
jgi:hypothetical protein